MGQFRATECPVCFGSNGDGNWTCTSCTGLVTVHRELVRNLQHWRSLHEAREVPDALVSSDGREYSMWDVERFYAHRLSLPDRMSQSIQFCLYENMKEKDAAVRMGIKPSNPVATYATIGLTTLLARAVAHDLPGYFVELYPEAEVLHV